MEGIQLEISQVLDRKIENIGRMSEEQNKSASSTDNLEYLEIDEQNKSAYSSKKIKLEDKNKSASTIDRNISKFQNKSSSNKLEHNKNKNQHIPKEINLR